MSAFGGQPSKGGCAACGGNEPGKVENEVEATENDVLSSYMVGFDLSNMF